MNRRQFLRAAAIGSSGALTSIRPLATQHAASSWRTYELTTKVEILEPSGVSRVWLPAALVLPTPYQRTVANTFSVPGGTARLQRTNTDALGIVVAEFRPGSMPVVTLTSRVAVRDHAVDLSRAVTGDRARSPSLAHYLRPTKLIPVDGIVRDAAVEITRGARTDLEKARAVYDWIVENTFRDPGTRGCGLGDIRFMLETKSFGGKCADLNALFVGLARAIGLPARDVYGIRVDRSGLGYRSLGVSSEDVTRAQHCRAEVYLDGFGWVPVDPADVRKVMLEEPGITPSTRDARVKSARARLFGSWEMNWTAYNFAHDVALPGSTRDPLPFFMYPEAETSRGRLDSLEPERFRYTIAAREVESGAERA
jgi:transglutaminase-like putative cysteine protease